MRQRIKEVLQDLLKRIGARDIPSLTPVSMFSFSEEPNLVLPDGDLVMLAGPEPDWNALAREVRFEQVSEYAQATVLNHPLIEKAKQWGIQVQAVARNDKFFGCYLLSEPRQILLASPEGIIYFHELAHVAHEMVISNLVPYQTPKQEIVAALCAQVIWQIIEGNDKFLGNTYRLIARHSFKLNVSSPLAGCYQFLPEIHHATRLILTGDDI